jgi:ubiquinone/menaquinone biosynthesis C-methylase UbiE
MNLDEAERQVLATLHRAALDTEPTDREALEKRGECYWIYREDWSGAFGSLAEKGLIDGDTDGYRLTESGRPLGESNHCERPDLYWYYYQRFYPVAYASAAHSRFCERVYGEDLCQEGMTDMAALNDLLGRLDLKAGDHLLDLGCGAGVMAEYISDRTGARVTGLDYAASAIAEARERTAGKRDRLTFLQADMNDLDLPAQFFDAAISLDSLYWVADIADTLSRVARGIKPGGRIGVFMLQSLGEPESPEILEADKTAPARAFAKLNLAYQAHDYTDRNKEFWLRAREAAIALREDFEAEGNGFIAANWIRECEEYLPANEAGTIARYLYVLQL